MNNILGVVVSVLLVVLVVIAAGVGGVLLSGGRYHALTLRSTGPFGDMIAVHDKFSGEIRICLFEGDKITCRRPERIDVAEQGR